jgi:hypothetical protein
LKRDAGDRVPFHLDTIFGATMQFLYPGFLWVLTALAIPIILHLFYFRRYKKVFFSNLRFLREVKEETSARNKLRNLLILLARLLAMAFLILAFAQPFIPAKQSAGSGLHNVNVFIDNSFSMQSFGKDLSLFDRSRQKAKEIILGYQAEDRFRVMGHELTAAQQQWLSRDEAVVRLEELDFTPDVKSLSVVASRQKQGAPDARGTDVGWIISDFQKSITDIPATDTSLALNLLPMRGVQEKNVAIDSAWFESPVQTLNQTASLLFTLHNYAQDEADNIRVTIDLDGQERPEGTVDIQGNQVITDTANITVLKPGWHELAIRISDFPVTFDDTYYITFYVEEQLHVLNITDQVNTEKIDAVFADPANFVLDRSTSQNIQYASFGEYNLIVLNELTKISSGLISAAQRYVNDGGKVLFVPAKAGELRDYNALMSAMSANQMQAWRDGERQVGSINTDGYIYNDVFRRTRPNMRLPKVNGSYDITSASRRGQQLLTFRDGGDFATFYTPGKGAFTVLASPLDETVSDFTLQPEIFVPLLYKLALYTSEARKLGYTIGVDYLIPIDRTDINIDQDIAVTGTSDFIPGITPLGTRVLLDFQGQVNTAGFYRVMQDQKIIASFGFNYDRTESDLAVMPDDELPANNQITVWAESDETDFTQLIESTQQGKPLWKWCLILSLLFIAMEIALIRVWKNT